MAEINGATIIARSLKEQGVKNMYGVVGIPVVGIAMAAQREGLRYVGMRHEMPAAYAAQASSYLGGRVGAALAVSGPGALNAVAANERQVISDRTKRILRDLKKQGRKSNGTADYGYRFEGDEVVEDEAEQRALKDLRRWRRRGLSITRCQELLEEKGHQPRGAKWHRTTVSRLAQRLAKESDA